MAHAGGMRMDRIETIVGMICLTIVLVVMTLSIVHVATHEGSAGPLATCENVGTDKGFHNIMIHGSETGIKVENKK